MTERPRHLPVQSSNAEIRAFLEKTVSMPVAGRGRRGRLIFGMDATASRQPTWDQACQIQGRMFVETEALGGLEIQLAWYRGFGEFHAGPWHAASGALLQEMTSATCAGGLTQIRRLLRHVLKEHTRRKVDAAVFVGDCMEEGIDRLADEAGKLGLNGVPLFIFHEGAEPVAARGFRELARLARGAYCSFDAASPGQLRDLLSAVAVYAAGGHRALLAYGRNKTEVLRLGRQLENR